MISSFVFESCNMNNKNCHGMVTHDPDFTFFKW